MDNLLSAVAKFAMLYKGVDEIKKAVLHAGGEEFLKKAQAAMGTYEYGWPSLQPATIARKSTGDSPLVETGEMRASGRVEVTGETVVVEFTDPKMFWHEYGTSRVPPRPVIGGTIEHHGQEIAAMIGLHFGMIIGETMAIGSITSAISSTLLAKGSRG